MSIEQTQYALIEEALKNIPFDGWEAATFENAALALDMDVMIVSAVFPRGPQDYLNAFSAWADHKMIEALADININDLKVRARIRMAVEKRIEILSPYKESVRMALKKYMNPQYARGGATITWRTADVIWNWAGDDATDYNRYTKRGLLSGVIATTMAHWLRDESGSTESTFEFLNNRIENVISIGQNTSKVIKPLEGFIKNVVMPTVKSKMNKI